MLGYNWKPHSVVPSLSKSFTIDRSPWLLAFWQPPSISPLSTTKENPLAASFRDDITYSICYHYNLNFYLALATALLSAKITKSQNLTEHKCSWPWLELAIYRLGCLVLSNSRIIPPRGRSSFSNLNSLDDYIYIIISVILTILTKSTQQGYI